MQVLYMEMARLSCAIARNARIHMCVCVCVLSFQETNEQKLFKIASELLHTEKAYVARLNLLDQVRNPARAHFCFLDHFPL